MNSTWKDKLFNEYTNTLGNLLVIDIPKKHVPLSKKIPFFKDSNISELKELTEFLTDWNFTDYSNRDIKLKELLLSFFKNHNENQ